MIRRFAEYFTIAWFSLPVTLLAQGAPGSIQGIVCEIKTCKPIDGVQVSLVRPGSKEPVKTMRTDVSGEFGFFDLQPAREDIWAFPFFGERKKVASDGQYRMGAEPPCRTRWRIEFALQCRASHSEPSGRIADRAGWKFQ